MSCAPPLLTTRPASVADAPLVYRLYLATPGYFDIISIPVPTLAEVRTDLDTADRDPRRYTELVLVPLAPEDGRPDDERSEAERALLAVCDLDGDPTSGVGRDAGGDPSGDPGGSPESRTDAAGTAVGAAGPAGGSSSGPGGGPSGGPSGGPGAATGSSQPSMTGSALLPDVPRQPRSCGGGQGDPGDRGGRRRHAVVGYLDYKLDYPEYGDATVNLLLIHGGLQSRGFGRHCVADLEARLAGRARRVLASIYGQNPRAERFWRSLGYHFAIDAKPILDWYAKSLEQPQSSARPADPGAR